MSISHPPALTALDSPCWADPLTRPERAVLARLLARAARHLGEVQAHELPDPAAVLSTLRAAFECADLHLDVTERAAVLPRTWQDRELASAIRVATADLAGAREELESLRGGIAGRRLPRVFGGRA